VSQTKLLGLNHSFFDRRFFVNRFARIAALALVVVFVVLAVPAFAQPPAAGTAAAQGPGTFINLGASLGVGLTVIGAAYGIGRLAASAYEGMARQPEVAGNIQTAMIIAAALIEGFTFFALVIFFMGIKEAV
jgi:F-type H+-transporting ATPase subunit c